MVGVEKERHTFKSSDRLRKIILFLVWPFAAFLQSFLNAFRSKQDVLILFLFSGFVGLCIAIDIEGTDINFYKKEFFSFTEKSFGDFWELINNYIHLKSNRTDIGIQIICFATSRITSMPEAFFLAVGLVYGFFYAKLIGYATSLNHRKNLISYSFILLLVFFIFPTQAINQRFWIAGLMVIYGFQKYIIENKSSGLWYIFLSPTFHLGMFVVVAIFIFYKLTAKIHRRFLYILILIGLYFSHNFTAIFEPIALFFGGAVAYKFDAYSGDFGNNMTEHFNNRAWYAVYWRPTMLTIFSVLIFYITLGFNNFKIEYRRLLRLNICLLVVAALFSNFSMSFRYFELISFIQIYTIYIYIQTNEISMGFKRLLLLSAPGVVFVMSMKFSAILQFLKPTIFIVNLFIGWFIGDINSIWWYIDPI